MSEIAVDAAISFFQTISKNSGKPVEIPFSTKTASADIAGDASKFGTQLVADTNLKLGTDLDSSTLNINEFTRLISADRFKKFSEITDDGQKAVVRDTFDQITKGKSLMTASDIGEFLRVQDSTDGTTDGHATVNFLI